MKCLADTAEGWWVSPIRHTHVANVPFVLRAARTVHHYYHKYLRILFFRSSLPFILIFHFLDFIQTRTINVMCLCPITFIYMYVCDMCGLCTSWARNLFILTHSSPLNDDVGITVESLSTHCHMLSRDGVIMMIIITIERRNIPGIQVVDVDVCVALTISEDVNGIYDIWVYLGIYRAEHISVPLLWLLSFAVDWRPFADSISAQKKTFPFRSRWALQ